MKRISKCIRLCGLVLALSLSAVSWPALARELPPATVQAVDELVARVLKENKVPSASIAVTEGGEIVMAKTYGMARLEPAVPASVDMRYKIASNSKHMTAAAVLLLAEQGKLGLDDKVGRFLPNLRRSQDISLRQLMTHSSGYQDYYAIDYLPVSMEGDVKPEEIVARWAMQPLDFEPGTRFQYSNTGYVVLGLIVEKVSGQPLMSFLRQNFFEPLQMRSPISVSSEPWSAADPVGYTRYALGPAREARHEGRGWMASAGELAMTASDLARWDIALMEGRVLKPTSMKALTTVQSLSDGTSGNYALGLGIFQMPNGQRRWTHSGGASGFLSRNLMFPDAKVSLTVLTNGEADAYVLIAEGLEKLILAEKADSQAKADLERSKTLFAGLQKGQIDRSVITSDLSGYFSAPVLADFASSLAPLGELSTISETSHLSRGGMTQRIFALQTEKAKLRVEIYVRDDGRFNQFLVFAE